MKTFKVAVLALVAMLGWSALNSDTTQMVDDVRSGSRKLLAKAAASGKNAFPAGNPMATLITVHYPPPPPSHEYVAAIARQQRLRDLLYGSLTPPGMQAMVSPDGEAAPDADGAPSSSADGPAAGPEEAEEAGEAEEDPEHVKDGGPMLVLGVTFVLVVGIGGAVFAIYKMKDSAWLNDALKKGGALKGGSGSSADSHSASRSEVLKAKMAKLRESINNSA